MPRISKFLIKENKNMSKTFNKYIKILKSGKFTESEISSFRQYLGSSSALDSYEKGLLWLEFERAHKEYKITKEQTQKGIQWLKNYCWTKSGRPRQAKNVVFGYRERAILLQFSKFRFTGLFRASENSYDFYTPIYRVYAKNGAYFDYTTDRGKIEVVS